MSGFSQGLVWYYYNSHAVARPSFSDLKRQGRCRLRRGIMNIVMIILFYDVRM